MQKLHTKTEGERGKMTVHPRIYIQNPYKERVNIVGMVQSGKTNLLLWLLKSVRVPYILFDPLNVVKRAEQSGWQPLDPATQQIVSPAWNDIAAEFNRVALEVWNKGNMILIVDEIALEGTDEKGRPKPFFCNKYWKQPVLSRICNQGGNRNISLWGTSQRAAQVHNDILANSMHHFIFRLYLPQDIEWMSKVIPRTIAENTQNLQQYSFVYYQLGSKAAIFNPIKRMY